MGYIDADKEIKRLEKLESTDPNDIQKIEFAKTILKEAPRERVKPIVTGEWQFYERYMECSECNEPYFDRDAKNYNFCPICGADMREGK